MSILRGAAGELRSTITRTDWFPGDVAGSTGWGPGMVWQGTSPTSVTNDSAMRLSAVFACLRILTDAISTLPLDTYERRGGVRLPYRPRPAYLSFQPPQGSRIEYLTQVMLSLLTDGNAFILTPRDALGEPVNLTVLDPTKVTVTRKSGVIGYQVEGKPFDPYDIMHIPGLMMPGEVRGLSPIAYARETIGLGLAAQRFGANFFENGALPGAVIEAPNDFGKDSAELFKETWNGTHRGVGNAHKVGVLTNGATLNKVSIQPNDAQFLETRQFQVPDIARIFGVPPHLIADASNSTSWGSGLAEQNIAFGQFSLRPWTERIEDGHGRLLTSHGLDRVFVKLNLDALLRASLTDRYNAYQVGINSKFLLPNEARSTEDLPPIPGGDTFPTDPPGGGA